MPEEESSVRQPEAVWDYTLSEEEIYNGLRRSSVRRVGPVGSWVRTAILAVVALGCIGSFILDQGQNWSALLLGCMAAVLIAVLWITPPLRLRHTARQMAEGGTRITVCLFPDGIAFGGPEEELYAYTGFFSRVFEDMVVCELPGYQLVLIPRRAAVEQEQWDTLCSRLEAAKKK